MLRLDTRDEDEEVSEGASAEVDTPGFRFDKKGCRLVGQQEGWEKEAQAQDRVKEVLAFYYFSEGGIESQRQAAEWAAGGWQQPADWGSCLDWIADQWGATEDTTSPRTRDNVMLMRLQFSSRTRLVGVLLWQQRQRSCTSAVRQWQRECSEQKAARRAAGGWARVWGLFGQLTWRGASSQ